MSEGYSVGILAVNLCDNDDADLSAARLEEIVKSGKHFPVTSVVRNSIRNEPSAIEEALQVWSHTDHLNLILSVGGCGISKQEATPEATRAVLEREAPHIPTAMVMHCAKSSSSVLLSRPRCGTASTSLILNLPGDLKEATESLEYVAPVLPHAMDQLLGRSHRVASRHKEVQGDQADRTIPSAEKHRKV